MLRVAVPNKGSLSEAATQILREAGYRQRHDRKDLFQADPSNDVEFFYIRPRDVAIYVGLGTVDVGITGRDLLLDSRSDAEEVLSLGFGRSSFRFAAMPGAFEGVPDLAGKRIATSFVSLVEDHLAQAGVTADIIHLDGAVESSIRLGVADAVADVVETGTTLRQAGLETFGDPVLESEAVLIKRPDSDPQRVNRLLRRLEGLIIARRWVVMEYDVPADRLDAACEITPGRESPTVSPLKDKGWFAVRAMVERHTSNAVMDELDDLGARAVMVTEILSCRL